MLKTETGYLEKKLLEKYNPVHDYSGIRGERLAHRLSRLSEIGLTEEGGSYRIGFSKEEREAKELVKVWMKEAGLSITEDGAGNIIGRIDGIKEGLPPVLSGSHVDSVPNGGHFDGPLGVLAALEVAEAWKETNYQPNRSYEVVIFSDEEGARFNGGLRGSRAMCGDLDMEEEKQKFDLNGTPYLKVVQEDGLTLEGIKSAGRDMNGVYAYLEVHIEQGKTLERENVPVGIVTGIAGPRWLSVIFKGKAGHAGNTPMKFRNDALVCASEFINNVSKLPEQFSTTAVATVGKLDVYPNGVNVIPEKVELSVDIRDIQQETLDRLTEFIKKEAEEAGKRHRVEVEYKQTLNIAPVQFEKEMLRIVADAVKENGITPIQLPSGAGHDAMVFGRHVPSAMIFVRSKDGVSHSPREWSELSDCVQAVHVLKSAVEALTAR